MLLIALWYFASVVCNQSSKVLLDSLDAQSLTLAQLLVSAGCGVAVILCVRMWSSEEIGSIGFRSRDQLVDTALLSAAFTGGFVTLNACMQQMHVSLVMVLRAAEPLTTLALGAAFFGASVPVRQSAALLAIVAGCALSAAGPFQTSGAGIALASLSNVCFSLRGLLGKRLARRHGTGALESFFQLCALGAVLQAGLLLVVAGPSAFTPLVSALTGPGAAETCRLVLVNGASFYAYLQLSWVCLGRMSAVSHSVRRHRLEPAPHGRFPCYLAYADLENDGRSPHQVANSLRRPVTVIAALLYAPVALSPTNLAGIVLACAAAAAYGLL